jgi:hypothetical protein
MKLFSVFKTFSPFKKLHDFLNFSPKIFVKKLAILTQNKAKF